MVARGRAACAVGVASAVLAASGRTAVRSGEPGLICSDLKEDQRGPGVAGY